MAIYANTNGGANAYRDDNQFPPAWAGIARSALIAGGLALLGLIIGSVFHVLSGSPKLFYQAYMYGWMFWMAVTLGCFVFLLLTNITRATWGFPILRLMEAGSKLLPFMGILFLPIIFNAYMGSHSIYPWADYAAAHADEKMAHRYAYMNPTAWMFRTVLYFGLYSLIAFVLARMSNDQDKTRNAGLIQTRVNFASVSFVLFVLTGTFAYVDWVMSLDPHWYSTIYGLWFLEGASFTALAFLTIIGTSLKMQGRAPYAEVVTQKVTRDWGNLLLTLSMVWAYFSLSQFLITWSGNLPEEITYYIQRNNGTTAYVTTLLVISMFFIPFMCLLSGKTKRSPMLLRSVAIWILAVRVLESFWNIVPFYPRNLHTELLSQLDFFVPVGHHRHRRPVDVRVLHVRAARAAAVHRRPSSRGGNDSWRSDNHDKARAWRLRPHPGYRQTVRDARRFPERPAEVGRVPVHIRRRNRRCHVWHLQGVRAAGRGSQSVPPSPRPAASRRPALAGESRAGHQGLSPDGSGRAEHNGTRPAHRGHSHPYRARDGTEPGGFAHTSGSRHNRSE